MFKRISIIALAITLTGIIACGSGADKDNDAAAEIPGIFERPGQVDDDPFFNDNDPPAETPVDEYAGASVRMSSTLTCPEFNTVSSEDFTMPRLQDSDVESIRWELKVTDPSGSPASTDAIELVGVVGDGEVVRFNVKCGRLGATSSFVVTATAFDIAAEEVEVEDEVEVEALGMIASASMTVTVTSSPLRNKTFEGVSNPATTAIEEGAESANYNITESAEGGSNDPANYTFTTTVFKKAGELPIPQEMGADVRSPDDPGVRTLTFSKVGTYEIHSKVEDSISTYEDEDNVELQVHENFTVDWRSRDINGDVHDDRSSEIAFGRGAVEFAVNGHADSYSCEFADDVETAPDPFGFESVKAILPVTGTEEGLEVFLNFGLSMLARVIDKGGDGSDSTTEEISRKTCMLFISLPNTLENKIRLYKNGGLDFQGIKIKAINEMGDVGVSEAVDIKYIVRPEDVPLVLELKDGEDFRDDADKNIPPGAFLTPSGVITSKRFKLADYEDTYSKFQAFGGIPPYSWNVTRKLTGEGEGTELGKKENYCAGLTNPKWRGLKYRVSSSVEEEVVDNPEDPDDSPPGSDDCDEEFEEEREENGNKDLIEIAGILDYKTLPDGASFRETVTLELRDACGAGEGALPAECNRSRSEPKTFKIAYNISKGKKVEKVILGLQVGRHHDSESDDGAHYVSFCDGPEFSDCAIDIAELIDDEDGNDLKKDKYYTYEFPVDGDYYEDDFRYFMFEREGNDDLLIQGVKVEYDVVGEDENRLAYVMAGSDRWTDDSVGAAFFGPHDQMVTIITTTGDNGTDAEVRLKVKKKERIVERLSVDNPTSLEINDLGMITSMERRPYFDYDVTSGEWLEMNLDWEGSTGHGYNDRAGDRKTSYGDFTFDVAPFGHLEWKLWIGESDQSTNRHDAWEVDEVELFATNPAELARGKYDNCFYKKATKSDNDAAGMISSGDGLQSEFLQDGTDPFNMIQCDDSDSPTNLLDRLLQVENENGDDNNGAAIGGFK